MQDFIKREATINDLDSIVDIYNNVILKKTATARTQLISPGDEKSWFKMMSAKNFPINVIEYNNKIVAWTSFDAVMDFTGPNKAAELLIFIDRNFTGKKFVHNLINLCLKEAPKYGIKTLLTFLYRHDNANSIITIFKKFGFKEWGSIPEITNVDDTNYDLIILGIKIEQ